MLRSASPVTLMTRVFHQARALSVLTFLLCLTALPSLSITLIDNGSTDYVIAKQTGCDSTTSSAATDIQTYIKNISGGVVTIPINSYADMSTVPSKAIVIGNLVTAPTLALEEVEMKVSGDRLILRGGSSLAHRYAVFTFLEDHLGCRYYSPTVEYLPSISTITVPSEYEVTHTPSFEYRYIYHQDVTVSTSADWRVKNRVNGQLTINGTHNMFSFVPPATYFSQHPEYYPLNGGVRTYNSTKQWLCFTNPDIPAIIAQEVINRMGSTSANTIINVGQGDDYGNYCECAACQTAYANDGNAWSGVMLQCLNAAADIVAQTYPNRKMMTFAYMHTEKPPTTTAPRPNLIIRLCHWKRCDLHGLEVCGAQSTFNNRLANWQALTDPEQLYIWHYTTSYTGAAAPWPNVRSLIPDIKYYWDNGVGGLFYQGVYWSRGGDLSELKTYLQAKAMWDKDVNATTIYNDFMTGYYGAAADDMDDYVNLLEDQVANWHPNGITATLDQIKSNVLPPAVFEQADAYFDAAEAAASAVSQTLFDRVQYARLGLLYLRTYDKKPLSQISSPANRLVKLGDNQYYLWKEALISSIGNRGIGGEYSSSTRALLNWKPYQAGDVVAIENDALKIEVCPWVQGAMVTLIDKTTGRQLIMPAYLALDETNYPFNGYYWEGLYKDDGNLRRREAAASHSLTIDPDGTQHLTVVINAGVGAWTPSTPTQRLTREIILPPGNTASFNIVAKVKNLTASTTFTDNRLEGRLALGDNIAYSNITATEPNDSSATVTTFPTTLDVKQLDFDNTQDGYRLSLAFSDQLPTTSATIDKNSDNTMNTVFAKFSSGTFSLLPAEEVPVMDVTWTLSAIQPVASSAVNVVFKDLYRAETNYDFGSMLWKTTGLSASWNTDATSSKLLGGDCYVEWTFGTRTAQNIFGLSHVNANQSSSTVKYSIRAYSSSGVYYYRAWENNAYVGTAYTFSSDLDRFRIERVGNTVYYKCNGSVFHTSALTSTTPLMVDCSIYTAGERNGVYGVKVCADTYIDAPLVELTGPLAGNVSAPGSPLTLTADASPTDGSNITKVEFYRAGTTKLGESTASPYSFQWDSPTSGTHSLTARAFTSNNGNTTSRPVSIRVNTLPTVSITNPKNNDDLKHPTSITIEATAADSDGDISKVEFYEGANKLGEDDTAPYSYEWSDVAIGEYSLTAKAIDNDGGVKTSTAVNIGVHANYPPLVLITAPADGTVFIAPANITIEAVAADSDGIVTKVEFYNGANKLGEDDTAPYSFNWTNVSAGSYTLTAKAIDENQGEADATIDVYVTSDTNALPTVSITSPTDGTVVVGSSMTVTATASDSDGTITRVEFYDGATKLGEDTSSPYSIDVQAAGRYTLIARAVDNEHGAKDSSPVTASLWNTQDIGNVGLTGSASYDSGTFSVTGAGAGITGTADAFRFAYLPISGDCAITARVVSHNAGYSTARAGVMIRETLDVGSKLASTLYMKYTPRIYHTYRTTTDGSTAAQNVVVTALPYWVRVVRSGNSFTSYRSTDGETWTVVGTAHTVTMTDPVYIGLASNGGGTNQLKTATFDNVSIVPGNVPPIVNITAPQNGAVVTGDSLTITAAALDSDGAISKVEFYEGANKLGEDSTVPYSINWTDVEIGSYTLTAKAIDNDGGMATSRAVLVRFNSPPTVSLTAPDDEAVILDDYLLITADAEDADGIISKVEFYEGANKLGEDSTSPYSYEWTDVQAGSYTLTAKAYDNDGGVKVSSAVSVRVNAAPTVSITAPESEEEFDTGANITITATASDADGTITKVEFYEGVDKLGEDTTSPYSYYWEDVPSGSYMLTAVAYDNDDAYGESIPIWINVSTPPDVSITAPDDEEEFNAGANITITATASSTDGTITTVEFYEGANKLGEDTTSPYSYYWEDVAAGDYTLTAKAFDNRGKHTVSTGVNIKVKAQNIPPEVNLTAPTDGTIIVGNSYTLTATASDADGTVVKVEFYNGETKLGEDSTSPYSYEWTSIPCGVYSITARAIDDDSASTNSDVASLTVWNNQDIGNVGLTGSASYNSGTSTFTVTGAGASIVNTSADAFHFTYLPISGDCTMIARVVTHNAGYSTARAGVMIRETLDAGSKHVSTLYMKYTPRVYHSYRTTTDGNGAWTNVTVTALPYWVKLVRSGNNFESYHSDDGDDWTKVGSTRTVSMTDPVYIGLASSGGGTNQLKTATFDNVSITTP